MKNAGIKAGQDTLILNGYTFNSLGTGDYIDIQPQENITNQDVSANGTLLIARNAKGLLHTLTVRVPVGSADDKQITLWYNDIWNNFVNAPFLNGTYNKISYGTDGSLLQTNYVITAGTVQKSSGMKANATGDIEQMIRTWEISCIATTSVS